MRYWTEEQLRVNAASFLTEVQAVLHVVDEPKETNELHANSLKLLVKAALEPCTFLLDMYRTLGLHPAEGKSAKEDLIARGYVKVHRLARKGRGGQPQVIEVTNDGVNVLRSRGIVPSERVLKGGFKHDCYGRLVGRWAAANSYRCWFERTLGAKAFDVVYEDEKGDLHGVEICLTGSAELNARQLLKAAGVAGIVEVVALCETQAFAKGISAELGKSDELGLFTKKIRVELLAEFTE